MVADWQKDPPTASFHTSRNCGVPICTPPHFSKYSLLVYEPFCQPATSNYYFLRAKETNGREDCLSTPQGVRVSQRPVILSSGGKFGGGGPSEQVAFSFAAMLLVRFLYTLKGIKASKENDRIDTTLEVARMERDGHFAIQTVSEAPGNKADVL